MHSLFGFVHLTQQNLSARILFSSSFFFFLTSLGKSNTQFWSLIYSSNCTPKGHPYNISLFTNGPSFYPLKLDENGFYDKSNFEIVHIIKTHIFDIQLSYKIGWGIGNRYFPCVPVNELVVPELSSSSNALFAGWLTFGVELWVAVVNPWFSHSEAREKIIQAVKS